MNKQQETNILKAASLCKNICLFITDFTDIMSSPTFFNVLVLIEQLSLLRRGFYGRLLDCDVYAGTIVSAPGYISVSNMENPSVLKKEDWSPEISLNADPNQYERILKMKAFW